MLIRTTDDKALGCKQMQTTREMQNDCPNLGKLISGYKKANKPKIKKERRHGEKEGEKREKTTTLSENKKEASNVNEQRDKG